MDKEQFIFGDGGNKTMFGGSFELDYFGDNNEFFYIGYRENIPYKSCVDLVSHDWTSIGCNELYICGDECGSLNVPASPNLAAKYCYSEDGYVEIDFNF